jgi:hypothetical protein
MPRRSYSCAVLATLRTSYWFLVLLPCLLVSPSGCGGEDDATADDSNSATSSSSGGAGGAVSYPEAYGIELYDRVRINSRGGQPNHRKALADFDLRAAPFERVTLVVDLDTTCYPFESWQDNPPPAGENWPADCDAFDRNFEFVMFDPGREAEPLGVELARAITPFGGPLHLEVDITDIANGMPGEHRMKVVIPTHSDAAGQVSGSNGGWTVTARIDVVPGPAPREVLAVVPLYDGSLTDAAGPGALDFEVPEGVNGGRIEYRVTGHGGGQGDAACIGPAEEFCKRSHSTTFDGQALEVIDPWRTDCAELCTITHYGPADAGFDYCLENPCGLIASVKAPRANWCPGSLTEPFVFQPAGLLQPGSHSFSWSIDTLADGGRWRSSALYIGYRE